MVLKSGSPDHTTEKSYKDAFAAAAEVKQAHRPDHLEITFSKDASFALCVKYRSYQRQVYDFLNRVLITTFETNSHGGGVALTTTPFAELDREVLAAMHEKLCALGGQPPALPTRLQGHQVHMRRDIDL